MNRLNELEQLKNEYKGIPIPENGVPGVQAAIEAARQKKRLKKRLISYTSMAAAALLMVVVMPSAFLNLFAAGGAANESAGIGYDNKAKDMVYSESCDGAWDANVQESVTTQSGLAKPTLTPGSAEAPESAGADNEQGKYGFDYSILSDKTVRDNIKAEITRQIKSRGMGGEEAFVAMAASSSMLILDEKEAYYYLDEKGQLVIVFWAGELAPEDYGEIEFVIPDEVWK